MTTSQAPSNGSLPAIEGSCACGRIKYTGSQIPGYMSNCHCRMCQKISGAPYLTWAAVDTASLKWDQKPEIWKASRIADRGYCPTCGSSLTMQYHLQPASMSIAAGTIDKTTAPIPLPGEHIFVSEKSPWFTIPADGLDRFEQFDPPFQSRLDAWKKEQNL